LGSIPLDSVTHPVHCMVSFVSLNKSLRGLDFPKHLALSSGQVFIDATRQELIYKRKAQLKTYFEKQKVETDNDLQRIHHPSTTQILPRMN
jgi:hypothetical protein